MNKVNPESIYPEASVGRLKTTDDKSRSYATDTSRVISEHKSPDKKEKHRALERFLFFLDDHVFVFAVFGTIIAAGLWYFGTGFSLAGASTVTEILGIVAKTVSIFVEAVVVYAIIRLIVNVARGVRKKN